MNNIIQKYPLSHIDRLCVVRIFMNQTLYTLYMYVAVRNNSYQPDLSKVASKKDMSNSCGINSNLKERLRSTS